MIIRPLEPKIDGRELSAFDAAFTTDRVYRIAVDDMSVAITEEKLDAPFTKSYPFETFSRDLNEADFTVAAVFEEEIAGFALAKYEDWNARAVLTGIFVGKGRRGKGLGSRLLTAAEDWARRRGARGLWAETQNVNHPAIRFYRRSGFEFCGFDLALYNPKDVSTGETAFYFYKNL